MAKCRALLEWEEGRGLLAALRTSVHQHLGFASFVQYVESLFGYKPRSIEEKVRVAEALEGLPLLSADLREGGLSWSAVRELTRVATEETEGAWRQFATGKSVRQIEDRVSGRKAGDRPDSPFDPALRRHVLAFEVRGETLATFREAITKLRRDAGERLDDDSALLLMARHVLGGPANEGRANYQIAFTVCEHCQRGFQEARGERIEVEPELVGMANCDAQYVGGIDLPHPQCADELDGRAGLDQGARPSTHPGHTDADEVTSPVLDRARFDKPRRTRLDRADVGGITIAPHGNDMATLPNGAHNELAPVSAHVGGGSAPDYARIGGDSAPGHAHVGGSSAPDCARTDSSSNPNHAHVGGSTAPDCTHGNRDSAPDCTHIGGDSTPNAIERARGTFVRAARARENRRTKPERAKQSIPPATRRLVVRRDGRKCVVPGCSHATFLDVHHLELHSEGGGHEPDLLVVLCAAHHRALHRGQLLVEGSVGKGLVFRHADGSIYGSAVSPRTVAAQTQAFAALRRLGFREGEARKALDRVRTEVNLDPHDPEQVMRAALRVLTTSHATSLTGP